MARSNGPKIGNQAVGAYGELIVEAELIRHGWAPSNFNRTIRNATSFDIQAWKGSRQVLIRVKTCGSGLEEFVWGFKPYVPVETSGFSDSDFTVLVAMGESREKDKLFVVPTTTLRKQLNSWRGQYLAQPKKNGAPRKDNGQWSLRLSEDSSGKNQKGYGFSMKWKENLDAWHLLERA